MTPELSVLTVVGARPQFVKAAAVHRAFEHFRAQGRRIHEVLVHTGQHYDFGMSQVFFDELALLEPDHHLGVGSGPHGRQTGEMMVRLEPILQQSVPDVVVVHGDTNSTLAGAIVAAKLHIPIAHVESGMRSGRMDMPEEVNRVVADVLSTLLFCPTSTSVEHLRREGITDGVLLSGDVMHAVLGQYLDRAKSRQEALERVGVKPGQYVLVTVHRAANTDDEARLAGITGAIERLAEEIPVVFPMHPRTRAALGDVQLHGVTVVDPQGYLDMLCFQAHARAVITDSGGMQKESYWLKVPCVTIREETEWPETLTDGWNVLVGGDLEALSASALRNPPDAYAPGVLGDQDAPRRIVESLLAWRATGRAT